LDLNFRTHAEKKYFKVFSTLLGATRNEGTYFRKKEKNFPTIKEGKKGNPSCLAQEERYWRTAKDTKGKSWGSTGGTL